RVRDSAAKRLRHHKVIAGLQPEQTIFALVIGDNGFHRGKDAASVFIYILESLHLDIGKRTAIAVEDAPRDRAGWHEWNSHVRHFLAGGNRYRRSQSVWSVLTIFGPHISHMSCCKPVVSRGDVAQ